MIKLVSDSVGILVAAERQLRKSLKLNECCSVYMVQHYYTLTTLTTNILQQTSRGAIDFFQC